MYVVAVIDWYSRYIIDWDLSDSLCADFVVNTVQRALQKARPDIINSDQGCQFTSDAYTGLLKAYTVNISMNGKSRALDNIITERFWQTLTTEEVYIKAYTTPRQTREEIASLVDSHNNRLPHQPLGCHTPAEVYSGVGSQLLYA